MHGSSKPAKDSFCLPHAFELLQSVLQGILQFGTEASAG